MSSTNLHRSLAVFCFLLAALFMFAACASEKNDWQKAETEDSISAYRGFIDKHPDSEFAAEAKNRIHKIIFQTYSQRNSIGSYKEYINKNPNSPLRADAESRIQSLYDKRRPELQKVRRARIKFNTKFPQGTDLSFLTVKRNEDKNRALLHYAGIEPITAENADDCNKEGCLNVKIYAAGTALGKTYYMGVVATQFSPNKYLNTGARISGYILFEVNGKTVLRQAFKHQQNPPEKWAVVNNDYEDKRSDAPFEGVWQEIDFQAILFTIFEQEFGRETLIDTIPLLVQTSFDEDANLGYNEKLAELLAEVQPPQRIVALLHGNSSSNALRVVELTLKQISAPWKADELQKIMLRQNSGSGMANRAAKLLGETVTVPPRIIKALIGELKELKPERKNIRQLSLETLKKLTFRDFGSNFYDWMRWFQETYGEK